MHGCTPSTEQHSQLFKVKQEKGRGEAIAASMQNKDAGQRAAPSPFRCAVQAAADKKDSR